MLGMGLSLTIASAAPQGAVIPIAGLVADWNADSLSAGALSTNWVDAVGSKTLVPTASPVVSNATIISKSHNLITFDGTTQLCTNSTLTMAQPMDIWLVLKQVSWTGASNTILSGRGGSDLEFNQHTATPKIALFAGSAYTADNAGLAVGSWGIAQVSANGASSKVVINNSTTSTGSPGAAGINAGFTLGALSTFFTNIAVSRLLFYDASNGSYSASAVYTALAALY